MRAFRFRSGSNPPSRFTRTGGSAALYDHREVDVPVLDWLKREPGGMAYCTRCNVHFEASRASIRGHAQGKRHQQKKPPG